MLAIIIPFYKLSFFKATLQSLANQTNQRFNVYIGNDASPENPKPLVEKFDKQLNLRYIEFKNNLGKTSLTKQWERCIDLVEDEEWLMVLGDDDCLGEKVVEEFYKAHTEFKSKTNLFRFATQMIDQSGTAQSKVYEHPTWEKASRAFYRKHEGKTRSSLSEYVFKKEEYLKYKFTNYPLGWHSDDKAWIDFSEELPIHTINNAHVFIRLSKESISGKNDNLDLKRQAASRFYEYLVKEIRDEFTEDQQAEIVKSYFERTVMLRNFSFNEWTFLWQFYLKNSSHLSFKKFLKISIKSIFKNKKNY
ncbi:glycosyltransferase [Winogradskyella ursingii]|uniref:glycosyltransferase n=1 Tax=Winogradskyella ursingii TaxID=2686079 RepID=UPI0015C86FE5|nr:glycosyltransferase family 2 protein [Winogradskyella ursingii]